MNDEMIKLHQEVATKNSKTAIRMSKETREDLTEQMQQMNMMLNTLYQQVQQLEQKYNLLLTSSFKGGSTDV